MSWFKKNPFLGGLALASALTAAGALYFVFYTSGELAVQKDDYAAQTSALRRIEDSKPFPDEQALSLAEQESSAAATLLQELGTAVSAQIAPIDESLTPQAFQDKLNTAVEKLSEQAETGKVALPEDFYLGFDQYRAQPPSREAAPLLGQQLESMSEALSLIIGAGVRSINLLSRPPLALEKAADADRGAEQAKDEEATNMVLAPFDVAFTAEQSDFREALSAIISAEPLLVVRLLSIANSQPSAPSKQTAEPEGQEAAQPETKGQIPVLFGQETVAVRMRLASISGTVAPNKQ